MKKVNLLVILIAALTAVILITGCNITGPGKVIDEEKDFTDFNCVDIGSTFDAEITKSDSFSVTIHADESLIDYVVVSKAGNTLSINLKPRHTFTDFTIGAKTLKAEITMPALDSLEVSGASKATIKGFTVSEDFELEVSGLSSVKMVDIKVGNAEFDVSGASKVTGDMIATDVDFMVSGMSTIELTGSADNLELDASGASDVDLTDFIVQDADVELSGASKATVNVKGKLDYDVSAASSLYFLGNPTIGKSEVSGASTIKHK